MNKQKIEFSSLKVGETQTHYRKICMLFYFCIAVMAFFSLGAMECDTELINMSKSSADAVRFDNLPGEIKQICISLGATHDQLPQVMLNLQILKRVCKEWNILCSDRISVINPALAQATDVDGLNQLALEQLKCCCGNLMAALPDLTPEQRTIFMVIMKGKHLTLGRKIELLIPLILHYGLSDFELAATLYFADRNGPQFDDFFELPRRTIFEKNLAESMRKYKKYIQNPSDVDSDLRPDDPLASLTLLDFLKQEERRKQVSDKIDLEQLMHRYYDNPAEGKKFISKNSDQLTDGTLSVLSAIKNDSVQQIHTFLKNGNFVAWEVLWAIFVFGNVHQITEIIDFMRNEAGNGFHGFVTVQDGYLRDIDCLLKTCFKVQIDRTQNVAMIHEIGTLLLGLALSRNRPINFEEEANLNQCSIINDLSHLSPFHCSSFSMSLVTKEQYADFYVMLKKHIHWYERFNLYIAFPKNLSLQENSEKVGPIDRSEIILLTMAARLGCLEIFEKYLPKGKREISKKVIHLLLMTAHINGHMQIVKYLAKLK